MYQSIMFVIEHPTFLIVSAIAFTYIVVSATLLSRDGNR